MPDLRLALPAAALWLCCGLGVGAPASMPAFVVVAVLLSAGSLIAAARSRQPSLRRGAAAAALLATAAGLGAAVIAVQSPSRTDVAFEKAADRHARVQVELRVESAPHRAAAGADGVEQWRLRGTTVTPRGVPVSVVVPGDAQSVRAYALGTVIAGSMTVRANEPGEATSFTLRSAAAPVVREAAPPWLAWTTPVRAAFASASAQTPGDGGDLLPGLAIGDETAVTSELDAAMKTSSLSHLTAVSGANCALVTGLVFLLARSAGLGRRTRIVAAAGALAAFVALVGPGASVLRAATMAAVVLVALARGRAAEGLPALALAVIVLLVHDPWLSRDYGFALSVLATAGLLLLARPLALTLARWLPRGVALALAVPLAAQLACQPVLILLSPALPLFGVPANLVTEPAAPAATVLGCVACLLLPWAPVLGQAAVWLAWLPSAWIALVARFAAGLPGAALPWPDGLLGLALCALTLVAVAVLAARSRVPRVAVSAATIALLGGGTVYAGALAGLGAARFFGRPAEWLIAACDVGQGDALVVRDGTHAAMIDVGRRPQPVGACLDDLGIDRLDWVLLTHFDADHAGGVDGALGRTGRVIVGEPDRESDRALIARIAGMGIQVDHGHDGLSGTIGDIAWTIVWPPLPEPGAAQLSGNPGSLVVRTQGGGLSALFLGDLGEQAQEAMRRSKGAAPVDVVKVAHHGSADQSEQLYRELRARLGLVSVGADNGYGHPTSRALDLLARSGTAVARTDRSGTLLVSAGDDGLRLWEQHAEAADASGRTYPGYGRGGTWRHEATAGAAREVAQEAGHPRRARSRRSPGIRSARLRWCSSRAPKGSSPTARHACCATISSTKTRASRSATCRPPTMRRASSSRSRAPPCSGSPGSSASTRWRNAATRS